MILVSASASAPSTLFSSPEVSSCVLKKVKKRTEEFPYAPLSRIFSHVWYSFGNVLLWEIQPQLVFLFCSQFYVVLGGMVWKTYPLCPAE